jgi:competence protein ComEA
MHQISGMGAWFNFYFNLSKREFNGLLVLTGLIVLIGAIPYGYRLIAGPSSDTAAERLAIARLLEERRSETADPYRKTGLLADKKPAPPLFYFDPNSSSLADWERLGLSAKQSAAILRYRALGGSFRKKEDLQKMYTISPRMYRQLAPYVRISPDISAQPAGYQQRPPFKSGTGKTPVKVIELNGADSTMLCEIRGIGPAFARRIVRYRERIGGFYQKRQLMEVFGLDSLKFAEISDQVTVDRSLTRTININAAVAEDFKNNPYLRYKQINALIQYRKQHGNYINIADLNKVLVLDSATIVKIAPYLTF